MNKPRCRTCPLWTGPPDAPDGYESCCMQEMPKLKHRTDANDFCPHHPDWPGFIQILQNGTTFPNKTTLPPSPEPGMTTVLYHKLHPEWPGNLVSPHNKIDEDAP